MVDQTRDDGFYDIDFSFDPEHAQSFKDAMIKLGLTDEKGARKTEVFTFYEREPVMKAPG